MLPPKFSLGLRKNKLRRRGWKNRQNKPSLFVLPRFRTERKISPAEIAKRFRRDADSHLNLRCVRSHLEKQRPTPDVVDVERAKRRAARHYVVKVHLLLPHAILHDHLVLACRHKGQTQEIAHTCTGTRVRRRMENEGEGRRNECLGEGGR